MVVSKLIRIGIILVSLPFLVAWAKSVDLTADIEQSPTCDEQGTNASLCKNSVRVAGEDIARCDAPLTSFLDQNGVVEPPDTQCHRWNLVWSYVEISGAPERFERQIDWDPNASGAGWRLPTIKELIRLFTYENNQGIVDPVIKYWIENGCDDLDNDCKQVEITIRDGLAADNANRKEQNKNAYFISSTHRNIDNIDSEVDYGRANIMGIRIKDGKVLSFESGGKGNAFNDYTTKAGMLAICPGLDKVGGKITGDCDYRVGGLNGDTNALADYSVVPIFALKVKTIQVSADPL